MTVQPVRLQRSRKKGSKEPELKGYTVTGTLTLSGASLWVEATSKDHAKQIVQMSTDFDVTLAAIDDFKITSVRED